MPKQLRDEIDAADALPRRGLLVLVLGGLSLAALAACKTSGGPTPATPRRGHDGGPGGN